MANGTESEYAKQAEGWGRRAEALNASWETFVGDLENLEVNGAQDEDITELAAFEAALLARGRIVDRQLSERLARFGPFAEDVRQTLYYERDPEVRSKGVDMLNSTLTGSPWSSAVYGEIFSLDRYGNGSGSDEGRANAGARLRFLLETYTPGQPNPVGVIFRHEQTVADRFR